jgi:hypothetical protein
VSGGAPGQHFRLWLRAGLTGCKFAKLLAGRSGRVAVELHVDSELSPTAWLNDAFDEHAKADRAVIAVFPAIATEIAFVELLNELGTDSRWRVRRRSKTSPTGAVLVGLEWTTASGDTSDMMGFAPFATMPVPRRAPYVAIATWPGGRSNPFRGKGSTPGGRPGEVSFLDAAHGADEAQYEAMWAGTTSQVAALMSVPPDDPRLYRRAAFVISADHAAKLVFSG